MRILACNARLNGLSSSPDRLTHLASTQPEKLAVVDDRPGLPPRTLTYGQFNEYVNQLANGLIAAGVEPNDKVMWLGQNSLEVAAFVHAARKAGAVCVPLNYRLVDDEAAYVIDNSDSVVVFADGVYQEMLERVCAQTPTVRTFVLFGKLSGPTAGSSSSADWMTEAQFLGNSAEPPLVRSAEKTMIYTSGTTGHPKGAVRDAAVGGPQRVALVEAFGLGADDVYVTCGPLYHSGPGAFAAAAFASGQTVVVQHKFDAEDWLRLIDTYQCTTTFSAPAPIRMAVNLPAEIKAQYDVSSMNVMVANAAPWSMALKEAYVQDFPPGSLWEIYGSTELGVCAMLAPDEQFTKPGSCGRPAPGVEIALFDDDRNLITEPDVPGELFVKASSVFETYYKAPEKYEEDAYDGWHSVGDIAYRDTDGYYYICDRKRDMIISGGVNVYPAEIEAALENHPGVLEVAVIGFASEEWGESVLAVVAPHPSATLSADEVQAFARTCLAGYKVPRRVEFVDEIPKTGSNKILKRSLRQQFG